MEPAGSRSRRETWSTRAALVAGAVGLADAATAGGVAARVEVAALTAVTLAGFLVAARWPGMPPALLATWTFSPAVVLNLQQRGEGTMFLLVVAVGFVALVTADQVPRLAAAAIAVAIPPVIQVVRPSDWGWPFWMIGISFGWLAGEQMRRYDDIVAELAATRERLAERAVDVERRRIAAELHDLVGHSLTVVLLSITGARRLVHEDPDAAVEALRQAEEIGRSSLGEIRGSVRALRDDHGRGPGVAPTPAATDVPELVERMVGAGSPVDLQISGDIDGVEPVTGLVVYRVVQESLNNVARHAPGAPTTVALAVAPDAVEVDVYDAGAPGHDGGPAGVGLIGMRERVEAVGGTLQVGPEPGGWRVRARLPRDPARQP
ncbi:MAG: sensor histidine kinase [Acidimicrobiales bacterium]